MRKKLKHFICLSVLALFLLVAVGNALAAQAADDEDDLAAPTHTLEKAKHHFYPGGRDEDDLVVQATLPQPTRSPDAQPGSPGNDPDAGGHD